MPNNRSVFDIPPDEPLPGSRSHPIFDEPPPEGGLPRAKPKANAVDVPQGNQFWPGVKISGQSTIRGLRQAVQNAGLYGRIGVPTPIAMASKALNPERLQESIAQTRQEVDTAKEKNKPVLNTTSGFLGNLTGDVLTGTPLMALPGAGTYRGAALIGGLQGLLRPVASDESRGTNVGVGFGGGAIGNFFGNQLGTLARGIKSKLNPEAQRLAGVLERSGVPLEAHQKTGDRMLKNITSVLDYLPLSHGPQQAGKQAQQASYNKALSNLYGDASGDLTQRAMVAQKGQVGQGIGGILRQVDVAPNAKMQSAINDVNARLATQKIPTSEVSSVQGHIRDLINRIDPNTGTIPGPSYQAWRTDILDAIGKGETFTEKTLLQLRKGVDDAAYQSTPPDLAPVLKELRKQYATVSQILPVAEKSASGDINPKALGNVMSDSKGLKELRDLAKAGQEFLPNLKSGEDGVAQRLMYQALLTGGAGGGLGGLDYLYGTQDPAKSSGIGLTGILASLLLPRAVQAGLSSQLGNRLITKGVVGGTPGLSDEAIKALIRQGGVSGLLDYSSDNR